jgi:hypothetical protein
MCDLSPLFTALTVAGALIVASVAAIVVAQAANAGVFTAAAAPFAMGAAAVSAAAASVTLFTAGNRAEEFFICVGSPDLCRTQLSELQFALQGLASVLAVQALAAAAVAAVAWIPYAAQPAMQVIRYALMTQIAVVALVAKYAHDFLKCVESLGARQIPNPLIVAAAAVLVIGLPLIYPSRRSATPR